MAVLDDLKSMIADQIGIGADEIGAEMDIIKDLGCDSLDIVEMLMAVEEKYNIEIDDSEVGDMVTVGDVAEFIESKLN